MEYGSAFREFEPYFVPLLLLFYPEVPLCIFPCTPKSLPLDQRKIEDLLMRNRPSNNDVKTLFRPLNR